MKSADDVTKEEDTLAVRTAGLPLFTCRTGSEIAEIYDLNRWRQESDVTPEEFDMIMAELMLNGSAELNGTVFDLRDGQGLAHYL